MDPNPPQPGAVGEGRREEGKKNFCGRPRPKGSRGWPSGGEGRTPGPPRAQRPAPASPQPQPRATRVSEPARGAGAERPGGEGRARREVAACGPRAGGAARACQTPAGLRWRIRRAAAGSPRRLRAGAEARGGRSRWLEGGALAVARGRLNPFLPHLGAGQGGCQGGGPEGGHERPPWGGSPPAGHLGAPVQPSPDPQPPGPQPLLPPRPLPPNTLPVGPGLVGSGRQWPHTGGRSLHDPGWDGDGD